MIKSFAHLHHWLLSNDTNKPVSITITTDAKTVEQIGRALRDELNKVSMMHPPSIEPIKEGQIYGIPFKIEVR